MVPKECLDRWEEYLELLSSRNTEIFKIIGNSMDGFGTGSDECVFSDENFRQLYVRDFEQSPEPLTIIRERENLRMLSNTVFLAMATLEIQASIQGKKISIRPLRISGVFVLKDFWVFEHMHISMPWDEQKSGESYPILALEEQNRQLEARLIEKNLDLENEKMRLQEAEKNLMALQELLPMCSHCKRIRTPDGNWESIESWINKRTETTFSHSLCQDCLKKYYEDFQDSH